jgi:hypothetical protein
VSWSLQANRKEKKFHAGERGTCALLVDITEKIKIIFFQKPLFPASLGVSQEAERYPPTGIPAGGGSGPEMGYTSKA